MKQKTELFLLSLAEKENKRKKSKHKQRGKTLKLEHVVIYSRRLTEIFKTECNHHQKINITTDME